MMHIDLTSTFVGAFLLACLFFGLWAGRKTKTFEQFAVGDRNFSVGTLVVTLVATDFGGGFLFRDLENIYTNGLYYGLIALSYVGYYLFSRFMSLRMGEFIHHFSIAESMGSMFGTSVRFITAISSMLFSAGMVAIQLSTISRIIKLCCNIEGNMPTYAAILIILIYSTFGGIKAVTFTDIIQFITFSTLIPILIYLVGSHITNYKSILTTLTTHENFDLRQVIGVHPRFINTLFLIFIFLFPCLAPCGIQRIYMAKNVSQVRSLFAYTSLTSIVIKLLMACLAVLLLVDDAHLNPKELVEHILNIHDHHAWLKSFLCIGVLALAMSTADSNLHTASVLCAHDCTILFNRKIKHKLILAHSCSLLITLIGLGLSFYEKDLLSLLLLGFNFYIPVITIPFIMAVFGFRPSPKCVLLGISAGILTVISFECGLVKYLNIQSPTFPAMLMNLLFLVGSHYLLPQSPDTGWIGIQDTAPLLFEKQAKERKKNARKKALADFNLFNYLQKLLPSSRSTCVGLGLFLMLTQHIYLYTASNKISLWIWLAITGLTTIVCFYPLFKDYTSTIPYHRVVVYSYPLLLFFLLFISGAYILYIHHYSPFAGIIFFVNILTALLLLSWPIVVAMAAITLGSIYPMVALTGIENIAEGWNGGWLQWFYTAVSLIAMYSIILYWKNQYNSNGLELNLLYEQKQINQNKKLERLQYDHHFRQMISNDDGQAMIIPSIIAEIQSITQDLDLSKAVKQQINKVVDRLKGYHQFIAEDRYNSVYHLPLQHQTASITAVIELAIYKLATLKPQLKIIVDNQTTQETICCDPIQLGQLLQEIILFMEEPIGSLKKTELVYLHIRDTQITYKINASSTNLKILPALAFVATTTQNQPIIETLYQEQLDHAPKVVPDYIQALLKRSIYRITYAHYGCLWLGKEPPIVCIIPTNLNEIRDEVMNKLPVSPEFAKAETVDSLAQEKALEERLTRETTLTRTPIRETLQFIKGCHGDQLRASGDPYYTHPMAVAELLLKETKDPAAIVAALLHDVVEDSKIFTSYIQSKYGSEVAGIVATVTHMGDSFRKKKLTKKETEQRLKNFKDIRAIQVKLADRLHNVLTLKHRPIDKQIKVAKQTLDFYLPLAETVGVTKLTAPLKAYCEEILKQQ